jgi:CheY-like chemotaxis protein/anti-sigma regulatory factor (Ser/Thr protein kinase)
MKLNRLPRRDERDTTMLSELDGILKDCLDYTRTLIAELSPTVLYESGLAAAVAWLGRHMLRHGLTVEVKADHDLPPLPEDRLVLVFQTIRELLFNVIKHARVSSAVVNLSHAADVLTVTVTDKGVGFDPAQREHDPATGGKFGLFSIRERLESLGGSFRIESHPNLGTTATLTVSCRPVVEIEEASPTRPHTRTAPRRTADRGITVLLVDDHELVREGLRSVLESSDDLEIVGEAVNGEQAVQLARTLHPEVVVMDVNMPILNGIEATRRIKAEHPTTTIIGLSVHDDPQVAQSMKSAGATAFFTKGDSSQDLCDTIRIACAPVPA